MASVVVLVPVRVSKPRTTCLWGRGPAGPRITLTLHHPRIVVSETFPTVLVMVQVLVLVLVPVLVLVIETALVAVLESLVLVPVQYGLVVMGR